MAVEIASSGLPPPPPAYRASSSCLACSSTTHRACSMPSEPAAYYCLPCLPTLQSAPSDPDLDFTALGVLPSDSSLGEHAGGYLDVPFDYALTLLRESVCANWATGTPLPVEYQLLNSVIWEYAAHIVEDDAIDYIPAEVAREAAQSAGAPSSESDLLFETLFDSWYLEGEPVRAVAQDVSEIEGGLPNELTDDGWRMLLPALDPPRS